jgi:hypothetical protein
MPKRPFLVPASARYDEDQHAWIVRRNGMNIVYADPSPRPKKGRTAPTARKAKPFVARPAKHPLARKFRALEAVLHERGLGWAIHYAPRRASWPDGRVPARGKTAAAHLPASYQAVVSEIGYPMIGIDLYDDTAWSFLPPSLMAGSSCELRGQRDEEPSKHCLQAFFAATNDVRDVTGYTFVEGEVYAIRDGVLGRRLGSFDAWFTKELTRLGAWARKLTPKQVSKLEAADSSGGDPHGLLG